MFGGRWNRAGFLEVVGDDDGELSLSGFFEIDDGVSYHDDVGTTLASVELLPDWVLKPAKSPRDPKELR